MAQATAKTQDPAPYKRIEAHPVAGALGAEIRGVDWSGEVDDETFAEVHRAWLENQVIWFRDQDLTPDQHLAFAKRWGEIHLHPFNKPLDGHPQILEILKTEDQTRNNGGRWHTDQMYTAAPAKATTLFAREMPPYGGDTMLTAASTPAARA
jgi:taurine dioxygenase